MNDIQTVQDLIDALTQLANDAGKDPDTIHLNFDGAEGVLLILAPEPVKFSDGSVGLNAALTVTD